MTESRYWNSTFEFSVRRSMSKISCRSDGDGTKKQFQFGEYGTSRIFHIRFSKIRILLVQNFYICLAYGLTILRPSSGPLKIKGFNSFCIEGENLIKFLLICLSLRSKLRSLILRIIINSNINKKCRAPLCRLVLLSNLIFSLCFCCPTSSY